MVTHYPPRPEDRRDPAEQSRMSWVSDPRCTKCGEPTPHFLMSDAPGVCTTCYAVDDMPRFRELPPGMGLRNERRVTRFDHVGGNRYQAIWEES